MKFTYECSTCGVKIETAKKLKNFWSPWEKFPKSLIKMYSSIDLDATHVRWLCFKCPVCGENGVIRRETR